MECNKDEAIRARDIAQKKYESGDLEGAMRFALKAQSLFPSLEGIAQMITTFTIHLAWTKKIGNLKDWYSVLCVPMTVDDEALRKRYRELARQIHPDKNKSVGAAAAFQFVHEALTFLSNKKERASYDEKIQLQLKTPRPSKSSASPGTAARELQKFQAKAAAYAAGLTKKMAGAAAAAPVAHQNRPRTTTIPRSARPPAAPSSRKEVLTFWTSCNKCCMQFEFKKQHLNAYLRCTRCSHPFIATETVQTPSTEHVNVAGDSSNISAANPPKIHANTTDNVAVGTCSTIASAKTMGSMGKYPTTDSSPSTSGLKPTHPSYKKLKMSFDPNDEMQVILVEKAKNDVMKKLNEIRKT